MTKDEWRKFESEVEFHTALTDLIVGGHESGIDVERAWLCRTGNDHPDWEVEIVRLLSDDKAAGIPDEMLADVLDEDYRDALSE